MKAERIYTLWRANLKCWCAALEREWDECRRTGEVEAVHRLRVVLRRLRVGLRLGNRWLGKEKVAGFRKWSQRVSEALGPVRDVDVTLEWLAGQPEAGALAPALQQRRARLWRQARRQLTRLAEVPCQLAGDKRGGVAKKLARRFHRTLAEDRQEVLEFDTPLDPGDTERWHELRRDLRRIRYLWEMVLTPRERKKDALLAKLLALQDLLGNAQNCVAAMEVLKPLAGKPEAAAALRRLEQDRRRWLAEAQAALRDFQQSRALRTLDAEG